MSPREWTPALILLLITGTTLAQGPKVPDFACPKPPRLDRHGDPLPDGALARLGTVRLRHGHLISGAAFSADGKSIFASDYYSGVHVWDAATGKEVRRYFENDHYCHALAMSPDGRTLAVALGDLSIRLCDPDTGRELGTLPKQEGRLYMVFSPDGSRLATGIGYKSVRIYDVATRRLIRTATFPENVGDAAFSSDGKLIACGFGTTASLWDLERGQEVRRIANDPGGKHALRVMFAPGGGPMAVWGYDDGSVRLFDAGGTKELWRLNREGGPGDPGPWGWRYRMLATFSPDGKVLAVHRDIGRIELWDVAGGRKQHTLAFDSSGRGSILMFSPDGTRLASAGGDLWGGDHTIRVWDVAAGRELHPTSGHGAPVSSVAVAPDGRTVATAGQDGIVHLWDPATGKHRLRLEGGRSRYAQASFSGDGRQVIAWGSYHGDGTLRIWEAGTGRVIARLGPPNSDGFWEVVSADGKTAVSVNLKDRAIRFHALPTGEVTRQVADDFHRPVALSPTGDRLIGLDGVAISVADRKELVDVGRLGFRPWARFSADGGRIVAAVMSEVMLKTFASEPPADELAIVDVDGGKGPRRFGKQEGKYHPYLTAALSRDGRTVVTISGSTYKPDEQVVTLWEVETGRERGTFRGHVGPMTSVALSADGRLVVTGSSDTTALVWDATRRPRDPADRKARFNDLADDDAGRAYAALWAFVDAPKEAAAFLRDQSVLFEATDARTIQGWVRDLDSDRFTDRERASRQLGLVLDEADWHLKRALRANPSAEARRRIEALLRVGAGPLTGRALQRVRVAEILERIAGPGGDVAGPAVAVLEKLAAGPPGARPTREAQASLERLGRRVEPKHK